MKSLYQTHSPFARKVLAFAYEAGIAGHIEVIHWLERELDVSSQVHVGHIALAACLDWLEFRDLPGFRDRRPRLSDWFDRFQARPSMLATPFSGETRD